MFNTDKSELSYLERIGYELELMYCFIGKKCQFFELPRETYKLVRKIGVSREIGGKINHNY